MTADQALRRATEALRTVSDTPRLDAELLMAHAMGIGRDRLLLAGLHEPVPPGFDTLLERRLAHEPVAYCIGARAFWTIELAVGPGVLVPRADSETLIEGAQAFFGGTPGPARVLDLGTGPGTLLLAALAEWPRATGLGIDASERALAYAGRNARDLGLADRARFQPGDWTTGVSGAFDLILCNPPYVGSAESLPAEVRAHEPAEALFAGIEGLDDYRRIVPDLPRLLADGGIAAIEIGHTQAQAVAALLHDHGLASVLRRDLGGRPRALLAVERGLGSTIFPLGEAVATR